MFDAMQDYAATPATSPVSLDDMLDTYTFPDVDAINDLARAADAGLRFHPWMAALTQSPDPAGATITTPGGTTVAPAVVTLDGFWQDGVALEIGLDTDTAAGQTAGPFAMTEDNGPIGAAADLAPLLEAALTDVSVTANGPTLEFLATGLATTVTVTAATVS